MPVASGYHSGTDRFRSVRERRCRVGPRASQFLILAGKAKTLLEGRYAVRVEDVQALVRPALQHRLVRNFHAEAEGVTVPDLLEQLIPRFTS